MLIFGQSPRGTSSRLKRGERETGTVLDSGGLDFKNEFLLILLACLHHAQLTLMGQTFTIVITRNVKLATLLF